MASKLFFTDWEGPWIVTDFALELSRYLFDNTSFFEKLSQYDDYLVYLRCKSGYEAGDTLRLIAPFIVSSGITSDELKRLAVRVARYVKGADNAIRILQRRYTPVVISTSYMQYLEATARKIDIKGYLHGTLLDLERFSDVFDEEDRKEAEKIIKKISELPEIKMDVVNRKIDPESIKTIEYLDALFWDAQSDSKFIRKMRIVIDSIKVIGGRGKLEVVTSYTKTMDKKEIIAIGDSISDHVMLDWVRSNGGLAVSFNGNEYSLTHSTLAIISDSAFSEAAIVDIFLRGGIPSVREFVEEYERNGLKALERENLDDEVVEGISDSDTRFYWLNEENFQKVLSESIKMRKKVRGEAGKLG
jgi:predicted HAD superfamily phosphohydrolase